MESGRSCEESGVARSWGDQVRGRTWHSAEFGCHCGAPICSWSTPALVFHFWRQAYSKEYHRLGQGAAARRHRGLPFPRPQAHLGKLARAKWYLIAGIDGARRLEILRDGASLCAPSAGKTEFRSQPHRVAIVPKGQDGK